MTGFGTQCRATLVKSGVERNYTSFLDGAPRHRSPEEGCHLHSLCALLKLNAMSGMRVCGGVV